jgi:hypothetical protein
VLPKSLKKISVMTYDNNFHDFRELVLNHKNNIIIINAFSGDDLFGREDSDY